MLTAAAAKSLQSCLTLCDPIDRSPPGSPAPGILQARTLQWVALSFSNAWKWKVKRKSLSRVRFLATPWTTAYQAPPSMGFSRQEYWNGVPLPSPLVTIVLAKWHAPGALDKCHEISRSRISPQNYLRQSLKHTLTWNPVKIKEGEEQPKKTPLHFIIFSPL